MKCPERYTVIQFNKRKQIVSQEETVEGENHLVVEIQEFGDCYEDECVYWNKKRKKCKKNRR